MPIDLEHLSKLYQEEKPYLAKARSMLRIIIEEALARIEDKRLVRSAITGFRTKSLESLRRKAEQNGWSADDSISNATDMIGARLVCNNKEDVYRVASLIEEALSDPDSEIEFQDYIENPKTSGYSGIHLNIRLSAGESLSTKRISCEIQIRTHLQNSWAELCHGDIYKEGEGLPEDLRGRTRDLARILQTADDIAQDIRRRVTQERTPPERIPLLNTVSEEGLTHIFATVFGRNPPDYVIRDTKNLCDEVGLTSLEGIRDIVQERELRHNANLVYRNIVGWPLSNEELFALTPLIANYGNERAIEIVIKKAREEREAIEEHWRNEVLSELPDSMEEFIKDLEGGQIDIGAVSEAIGATSECAVCAKKVIDPGEFQYEICVYYECDSENSRIYSALINSGEEMVDFDNSDLCSYHAEQDRKDK